MNNGAPSTGRAAYLARLRREKRSVRVWQVALVAALFLWWELSTRIGLADGFLLSSPSRMGRTFAALCGGGELAVHIGTSCLETVVGFLAGTLLGTAVAVGMWWSEKLARILDPYLVVLNALPKTALGPIFIVWMGAGMGAIVVINSRTPSPRSSFLTCLFAVRDNVSSSAVASRSQMGAKNQGRGMESPCLIFPSVCRAVVYSNVLNRTMARASTEHRRMGHMSGPPLAKKSAKDMRKFMRHPSA